MTRVLARVLKLREQAAAVTYGLVEVWHESRVVVYYCACVAQFYAYSRKISKRIKLHDHLTSDRKGDRIVNMGMGHEKTK